MSGNSLKERLEELQEQLLVAEETLRAIRSGEVDALVIGTDGAEQLYTLRSAEQPYRVLVEAMQQGALTLTAAGDVLYCNRYFAELCGRSLGTVIGSRIWGLVQVRHQLRLQAVLKRASQGEKLTAEIELRGDDGGSIPVQVAVSPMAVDGTEALCVVVTDLTEQNHRAAQLAFIQQLAVSVSQADDVDAALELVVRRVCEHMRWSRGTAWFPGPGGRAQRRAAYPADTPTRAAQGDGLLAERAWNTGTPVFATDPLGDGACVALPIFARDDVVAVTTFSGVPDASLGSGQIDAAQAVIAPLGAVIQRKIAEERTAASLREKEALLQEVHHRVKNNLQVVASLLLIQSRATTDPHVRQMFQDSEARVRSMALVHEALYASQDLASVDVASYLERLADQLREAYGASARGVDLVVEAERLSIAPDRAVPVGLVITELVSNALKHAFPSGRTGSIRIVFREADGGFEFSISDDGVGIPGGWNAMRRSVGLQIVRNLLHHLGAEVTEVPGDGTHLAIRIVAPGPPHA
jgi:PAS domain S-box-containing protein